MILRERVGSRKRQAHARSERIALSHSRMTPATAASAMHRKFVTFSNQAQLPACHSVPAFKMYRVPGGTEVVSYRSLREIRPQQHSRRQRQLLFARRCCPTTLAGLNFQRESSGLRTFGEAKHEAITSSAKSKPSAFLLRRFHHVHWRVDIYQDTHRCPNSIHWQDAATAQWLGEAGNES